MSTSDEDEDLRRAIALSLQADSPPPPANGASTTHPHAAPASSAESSSNGFLLGRKQMEEDRLARLERLERKRQRSISPPPVRREQKRTRAEAPLLDGADAPRRSGFVEPIDLTEESKESSAAAAAGAKAEVSAGQELAPQFPLGVVRKTWVFGTARGKDVKLEEVLMKKHLRLAVISAFEWDVQWLLPKLDTERTKLYFVMQAKEEHMRERYRRESRDIPNLRLIFPSMAGQINCMHSKLMLLVYDDFLRVAVPTANLRDFDWGETGIMENSVFLIDLPRFSEGVPEGHKMTRFQEELLYFCEAQDMPAPVLGGIKKFDFSATGRMAFVHTIGGSHYGSNMRRTGIPGLSKAVGELGLQTGPDLKVDFAVSSVGSLNDNFVASMHAAARGVSRLRSTGDPIPPKLHERFSIYFPLHDTVAQSKGGTANGGTNCFQRHYWESPKFPRGCMRDYKSRREGVLSHNKMMFARGQQKDDDGQPIAWLYVGSANMSESAWGKVVLDKTRKEHKINCRNWECGVLLPVAADVEASGEERSGAAEPESGGSLAPMEVFESVAAPPFRYPGEPYGSKKPWFFTDK